MIPVGTRVGVTLSISGRLRRLAGIVVEPPPYLSSSRTRVRLLGPVAWNGTEMTFFDSELEVVNPTPEAKT